MTKKILLALTLLWVVIIFYFSSRPPGDSFAQSSFALRLFYRMDGWLDFTTTEIYQRFTYFMREVLFRGHYTSPNALLRKSAHVGVYFILGGLTTGLTYVYVKKWVIAVLMGLSLPTLIAVLDEYQQLFVGRSGALEDVVLDTIGAFGGMLVTILGIKIVTFFKQRHKVKGAP